MSNALPLLHFLVPRLHKHLLLFIFSCCFRPGGVVLDIAELGVHIGRGREQHPQVCLLISFVCGTDFEVFELVCRGQLHALLHVLVFLELHCSLGLGLRGIQSRAFVKRRFHHGRGSDIPRKPQLLAFPHLALLFLALLVLFNLLGFPDWVFFVNNVAHHLLRSLGNLDRRSHRP